ncbi:MAG: GspH/FimT family pseudopilin [bacterium]
MKRNRGFTIFEMLVVLAIIIVITSLALANYRQGQKNYSLLQAAQKLAVDLRQAQGMAVTGTTTSGQPLGGYGIYIQDSANYLLFLNTTAADVNGCPATSERLSVKTIALPAGVTMATAGTSAFFAPPEPRSCFNNTSALQEIYFTLTQGGNTKTVKVIKNGSIEIQ